MHVHETALVCARGGENHTTAHAQTRRAIIASLNRPRKARLPPPFFMPRSIALCLCPGHCVVVRSLVQARCLLTCYAVFRMQMAANVSSVPQPGSPCRNMTCDLLLVSTTLVPCTEEDAVCVLGLQAYLKESRA